MSTTLLKWFLITVLVGISYVSAQSVVPAEYFGMHLLKSQQWPSVPFGSLRLWDTDTRWQQMNPANGVFDFSSLDAYLLLANAHRVADVVLVLGGTPNWISSDPSNAVCDYATVATGGCALPVDLNIDGTGTDQAWRNFVYQVAAHILSLNPANYSRVTAYEMWNEFSRSTESWTGTYAQMVRLAQDAHCILKGTGNITATGENCASQNFRIPAVGIAPRVVLLSPSAQASTPDVNTLASYLSASGAIDASNVIATHNYTYGDHCCASAETLVSQSESLHAALTAIGSWLPVWSTEGSWGDTAIKEPDPDMQSAYIARAHLLAWSLGYKRMYWYAWGNSWGRLWSQSGINGCSDEGTGDGCTSPAARAYGSVYAWMVGNTMTQPCTIARYVYTCQLTKSDGTRMLAVWHTGMFCEGGLCSHVSYAVPSGFNSYLDLANLRRTVKGRFVWIGAKPILLLASTRTNGAKTQHSFNAQRESRNATRDSQVPLPSKALSLR